MLWIQKALPFPIFPGFRRSNRKVLSKLLLFFSVVFSIVPPARAQNLTPPLRPGTEIRTLSNLIKRVEKISPDIVEFMDCPDFGVEIRFGSDVPSLKVTEAEVRTWTNAELKRAAPRARILDTETQKRRLEEFPSALAGSSVPTTINGAMRLMDSAQRKLHLTVALHEYPDKKVILYMIHLDLARGAFVPSGLGAPIAVIRTRHGVVGSDPAEHPADEIQEAVVDLVREFAEHWTRANPSIAASPTRIPKMTPPK